MRGPTIPKEFRDGKLMILSGRRLIAFKNPDEDFWYVKTEHCNYCGECCMDDPRTCYGVDDEKKCNMLEKHGGGTWECGARDRVPYNCLDDPKLEDYPNCSIRYKKVKA